MGNYYLIHMFFFSFLFSIDIAFVLADSWKDRKRLFHQNNCFNYTKLPTYTHLFPHSLSPHTHTHTHIIDMYICCSWCNSYRRRKWTRRHEFKSWARLIAFNIALIPLRKVRIQLFPLQLWVNSRAD